MAEVDGASQPSQESWRADAWAFAGHLQSGSVSVVEYRHEPLEGDPHTLQTYRITFNSHVDFEVYWSLVSRDPENNVSSDLAADG